MIVSFESKDSVVLSKYLHNFEHPEDMDLSSVKNLSTMFALNMYFHKKVYRVDDLVIISLKGFIEEAVKYTAILVVGAMLASVLFSWTTAFWISFYTIIPLFMVLSADFRTWMTILKLKLSGHKFKITIPNREYVINKLLFRVEHGTK